MPPAVRDAFAEATIEFLAHPDHLDTLLRSLDTLSGTQGLTWLPSVCGRRAGPTERAQPRAHAGVSARPCAPASRTDAVRKGTSARAVVTDSRGNAS